MDYYYFLFTTCNSSVHNSKHPIQNCILWGLFGKMSDLPMSGLLWDQLDTRGTHRAQTTQSTSNPRRRISNNMSPKESISTWFEAFMEDDYLDDDEHMVDNWNEIKETYSMEDIKTGLEEEWIYLIQLNEMGDIEITADMVDNIGEDESMVLWLRGEPIVESLHLLDHELYETEIKDAYDRWGKPSHIVLPNGRVVEKTTDLVEGC